MKEPLNGTIVWEDANCKLYMKGKKAYLDYKGLTYHFGLQPFEPTTVIAKASDSIYDSENWISYIHNGFDIDWECKQLLEKGLTGRTITSNFYNAEHFCYLIILAIDKFFECSIDELEDEYEDKLSFENRTVYYTAEGVEFGRYGEVPDDDPAVADDPDEDGEILPEDQELYILVDGVEYALSQEKQSLHLLKRHGGKKKDHVHIHQMPDVVNDHINEMSKNEEFPLGDRTYNNEVFSKILAYAVRTGTKNYNFREIEKRLFRI